MYMYSVKWVLWSVKCKVCGGKCGVWSKECGVSSVEFKVWSVVLVASDISSIIYHHFILMKSRQFKVKGPRLQELISRWELALLEGGARDPAWRRRPKNDFNRFKSALNSLDKANSTMSVSLSLSLSIYLLCLMLILI